MLKFRKFALSFVFALSSFAFIACEDAAYDRIPEKIEGYPGVNLFVFHASWCAYCNAELPLIKQIYKDYSPCDLQVIGIDEDDSEEIMKAYVQKMEIPYKEVFWDFQTMKKFGHPRSIPTHFVIDSTGKIQLRAIGPLDEKSARTAIEKALGEKAKGCVQSEN